MGRHRKTRTDLPERVYHERGRYWYRPYGETRRVDLGANHAQALIAHRALVQVRPSAIRTTADVIEAYLRSPEFARLAASTQRSRVIELGNLRAAFGHMPPEDITPQDIYAYKRARASAPVRFNRELSALSVVMSQAIELCGLAANPCREVKPFLEAPRQRAPSAAELATFGDQCTAMLRHYIALKLMLGLRQGDMLALHRGWIVWDGPPAQRGLAVRTAKTGKRLHFRAAGDDGLSTGLLELLREILDAQPVTGLYVFTARKGKNRGGRYTSDGFKSLWQRAMAQWVATGGEHFREHDIRATAGLLVEDDHGRDAARKLLGHRDSRSTVTYLGRRRIDQVMPGRKR